jgi:hypothetical protein
MSVLGPQIGAVGRGWKGDGWAANRGAGREENAVRWITVTAGLGS